MKNLTLICMLLMGVSMMAQTTHNLNWYMGISTTDASLTIDEGDTVIWTFTDASHSVTNDAGSTETFDSGTLAVGSTYQYTFTSVGTNPYHCNLHPSMMGVITVNAVALCADPSNIVISSITDASGDVGWTENGTATEWEIEYGTTSFTPGTGTIISDNDGTLGEILTGLTASTSYDIYVTAICGPGDESVQVGPAAFTTLATGSATMVYGINNFSLTFVSFDITVPSTLNNIGPSLVTVNFESAGAIDPANPTTAYVLDDLGDLYSVVIATGVYTSLGNITPPGAETWTGMEFDPTTGILYAISSDGITTSLSTIDVVGLSATTIGVTGMTVGIALAIDGAGNVYGFDITDDNLYTIDRVTGQGDIVGSIGFDSSFGQGMMWDPNSDAIYMSAFNNTMFQAEWRSVNAETGATTLIGALGVPGTDQVSWVSTPGALVTLPICPEPTNLVVSNIMNTSADFSWNDIPSPNATNGFEWSVFANGADPLVDTPIDTGVTATGTTIASTMGLTAETLYDFYVVADCDTNGLSNLAGPVTFETTPAPPINDDLVSAIALTVDAACTGDAYTNVGATIQTGEPIGVCHFQGDGAQTTVWFTFTAPASGAVTVSTDILPGDIGDSQLTIYEAPTDVNDLSTLGAEVGCDEDSGTNGGLLSIATLTGLVSGDTYYIQFDGYSGAEGTFCMEVTDDLGIDDQTFNSFSYHPNPVSSTLSLKASSEIQQIVVYDLLGQEVLKTYPNSLESTLELSNVQEGAYLMKVTINGSEGTYRLIKE